MNTAAVARLRLSLLAKISCSASLQSNTKILGYKIFTVISEGPNMHMHIAEQTHKVTHSLVYMALLNFHCQYKILFYFIIFLHMPMKKTGILLLGSVCHYNNQHIRHHEPVVVYHQTLFQPLLGSVCHFNIGICH